MTAEGLARLIADDYQQIIFLHPQSENMSLSPDITMINRVVVYLPEDPYWLLTTLQQVASLLNRTDEPIPVWVLSRISVVWIWQTLQKLVTKAELLVDIRAGKSDLSCSQLAALLNGGYNECHNLEQQVLMEEQLWGYKNGGLTQKEITVLTDFFGGHSINLQSQIRKRSTKTLYSQRKSGLKKMAGYIPSLAENIPGALQKW